MSFPTLAAIIVKKNRSRYTLKLLTDGPVQLDDMLFVPAAAAAASTTYDLTRGKTSETDGRGRTAFYEYGPLGDLARVRDHNGAIVKQMEKVVAGRIPESNPTTNFTINGRQEDGVPLTFVATTTCGTAPQYRWDFGDGTSLPATTAASVSHTYNTRGRIQNFRIQLYGSVSGNSREYRAEANIEIRPTPVTINSCFYGVASIDLCGVQPDVLVNECNPTAVPTSRPGSNTYSVQVPPGVAGLIYRWEVLPTTGGGWRATGATGPSITVSVGASRYQDAYRCAVLNAVGTELGTSGTFAVQCYESQGTPQNPCPGAGGRKGEK